MTKKFKEGDRVEYDGTALQAVKELHGCRGVVIYAGIMSCRVQWDSGRIGFHGDQYLKLEEEAKKMPKFKVGDKFTTPASTGSVFCTVTAVGTEYYLATDDNGEFTCRHGYVDKQCTPYVEPVTHTFYLNVYKGGVSSEKHTSRKLADNASSKARIACKKIVVIEGEFDD
jgi:hypothetical protein